MSGSGLLPTVFLPSRGSSELHSSDQKVILPWIWPYTRPRGDVQMSVAQTSNPRFLQRKTWWTEWAPSDGWMWVMSHQLDHSVLKRNSEIFWPSAKSLHITIQKENTVIALNLLYPLKICFTRIIHFKSSNCGVRKFNSFFSLLGWVASYILESSIQSYSRNLDRTEIWTDLQRLPSPLPWRYRGLCVSVVWSGLVALTQLTATPPFTSKTTKKMCSFPSQSWR